MRGPRTVFGGTATAAAPRITQWIIGLCAVVWVLQLLPGSEVTAYALYSPSLTVLEPWRMITSAFLHAQGQPLHILFNMYALWLTGPYLEGLLGRARFLALYLISAFGGSVFFLLLADPLQDAQWYGGAVGASGAVFGMFGAFLVVQRRLGRETGPMLVVIGINAVLGFVLPNVAWQAHLGGLVAGLAAAAVLVYAPRSRRTGFQLAGLAAVVVALLVVTAAKIATVPAGAFL